MLLIGLGHKARQGKNTAALAMLNACPLDCQVRMYAYADALRREALRAINEAGGLDALVARGFVEEESGVCGCGDSIDRHSDPFAAGHSPTEIPRIIPLPDWVKPEIGKPRTLLQWWGTDYRRSQDPDYWVKRLRETLDREQPDVALITDVRFPNEADAIHAAGGYLVKCVKVGKPDIEVPPHPSELALDGYTGWDFTIEAATVAACRKQAAAIYKQIARIK